MFTTLLVVSIREVGIIPPTMVICIRVGFVGPLVESIDCINFLHDPRLTIGCRVSNNTINFTRIIDIHSIRGKGI